MNPTTNHEGDDDNFLQVTLSTSDKWRAMSNHLFMPRKLHLIAWDEAGPLLARKFLRFVNSKESSIDYLGRVVDLFLQFTKHPPSPQQLVEALQHSDFKMVAVPLLDHNAIVLFSSVASGSDVLVSALDVLPNSSSIHAASGDESPFSSACRLVIPRRCVQVSKEEATSVVFLEQLAALAGKYQYPLREPKNNKSQHQVTETRKPAIPTYVFDWLMNTLQHSACSQASQSDAFSKSIRLDSVRSDKANKPWTRSAVWVALKSLVHLCLVQTHGFHFGTQVYKCNMLTFQGMFVRELLQLHQSDGECRHDFGELREMCAYLTRKAAKLELAFPACTPVLEQVCRTCELVDRVLSDEWQCYLLQEEANSRIDLDPLAAIDFSADSWNPLAGVQRALQGALCTNSTLENIRRTSRHFCDTTAAARRVKLVHIFSTDAAQVNVHFLMENLIKDMEDSAAACSQRLERALQMTEHFIRLRLWPSRVRAHKNVVQLLDASHRLLNTYRTRCDQRYGCDPIRKSKMLLHCCALVAWMDAVYVQWDPLKLLESHQLFAVPPRQLEHLLLMDAGDVALLHQVHEYTARRTAPSLKPGIDVVSEQALAFAYASKSTSMQQVEEEYFKEDERLRQAKERELDDNRKKFAQFKAQVDKMQCECRDAPPWCRRTRCEKWGKCSHSDRLNMLEFRTVDIHERRLPDDPVQRRTVIFHQTMPKPLLHLMESCALVVSLCLKNCGLRFEEGPYRWDAVDYKRFIALGSRTKPFGQTHYGKNISILSSSDNFFVPQGKNVHLVFKNGAGHHFLEFMDWDVSPFCNLPVEHPFQGLDFAVHGTSHSENRVLAVQCLCPAELELTSFKEFGTLRAGGYLQWRNMAVAFEGSALDLNDRSVVMLILQAAYQVGPLPSSQHWNFDLSEEPFVDLLCAHIELAVERMKHNWSAFRALFVCVAVLTYIIQHAPRTLVARPSQLLVRCRQISIQWSQIAENAIRNDSSKSLADAERLSSLLYINSVTILTFTVIDEAPFNVSEGDLFDMLKARAVMYEQRHVTIDQELQRIVSLCSRVMARYEDVIHQLLQQFSCRPLNGVAKSRWPQCSTTSWSRCADSDFYQGSTSNSTLVHFNVFDGAFLVDGQPIGRLPDSILQHALFQRNFAPNLLVIHRGGGVFETTNVPAAIYTFANWNGDLIVREQRRDGAFRLISSNLFEKDLPQPLVDQFSFWMSCSGRKHAIEVRRPNKAQMDDFSPEFRIDLNSDLHGRVVDVKSGRLLLNVAGDAFNEIFKAFVWRLEAKPHVIPYLPRGGQSADPDDWSLCLHLPRLHQHLEVLALHGKVQVRVREFDNMTVSPNQFLGTLVGLRHKLILERPNGMRTVIVPHLSFHPVPEGPHVKVLPTSPSPDAEIPFFSFDEDPSLKQIRPHGSETLASWLMCVHLHGLTSSAMRDPLTQLTGLEMAVTQLRRCYSNKPLDKVSLRILEKIGNLSPSRSVASDTELVEWGEDRPPYSSSEVYGLLVKLIEHKTRYLAQLHKSETGTPTSLGESCTLSARAYLRYEWAWSNDCRLSDAEKAELKIGPLPLPKVKFQEPADPNDVFLLVHATQCLRAFDYLLNKKCADFSWAEWLSGADVQPVQPSPQHVGHWSTHQFHKSFLSLCVEALTLSRCEEPDQRRRFALMLSFMAWKDEKLLKPAIELLRIIRSDVDAAPLLQRFQLPSTSTAPGPWCLSTEEVRKKLRAAQTSDSDSRVAEAMKQHFPPLLDKIHKAGVWRKVVNQQVVTLVPSGDRSVSPFAGILQGCPELSELFSDDTFSASLTDYYHLLFDRLQVHRFGRAIDQAVRDPQSAPCCPSCYAPNAVALKKPGSAHPDPKPRAEVKFRKQNVIHGKCLELEREFRRCLVQKPADCQDPAFPLEFAAQNDADPIASELLAALQKSWTEFHDSNKADGVLELNGDVAEIRQMLRSIEARARHLADKSWRCLQKVLQPGADAWVSRCRQASGLLCLAAPRTLFPRYGRSPCDLSIEARSLLGEHLVYLVYLQKATRCLEMVDTWESTVDGQRRHFSQRLVREISEPHCQDWSPDIYHKWLLFEVEANVMIRRIQAQVALQVIEEKGHILQLNMGEGKTSVISPLVCSSFADGKHVAQLTLMTSLLETHGQELALKLGGLLEQPVYFFPCRRDVHFDQVVIDRMIASFRECVSRGGCIVTVPEFRLSLLLKLEEMCIHQLTRSRGENIVDVLARVPETSDEERREQVAPQDDEGMSDGSTGGWEEAAEWSENMGDEYDEELDDLDEEMLESLEESTRSSEINGLLQLLDLHRTHLVDIVDESDEILRHKYQLLYTMGSQQAVDGGERRWQVLQAVLNLLLRQAEEDAPERGGPAVLPILRDEGDDHRMAARLVDDILAGRCPELAHLSTLNSRRKDALHSYLCNQLKSPEDLRLLKTQLAEPQFRDVLVLRGLLSYGVLAHSLRKRWSVDYGVDVITNRRLMAVPFRGKDTPMARTEFGHPDVSLVLTHLSYYHTGLDGGQVKEALVRLKQMPQAESEYRAWLEHVDQDCRVIGDVHSINLDDADQLELLGRLLRFNRACIHFWLNGRVLPKETRQFPFKLMATAWDLARQHAQPMRGFSGTKDSSYLLPANVRLGSLPQLQSTDGEVLARVTAPCNRQVLTLPSDGGDVSALSVIDFVVAAAHGNILIDCGALMVGMSNRQVASYWLSRAPAAFMAAAYFQGDRIMVLLRDGHTTPLSYSPLKGRLASVLIYMDDVHTRGTDFKLPIPAHGFVTLGPDLPKDKLVQACMRMRHLGHGHSVTFLAPGQIYAQLHKWSAGQPADSRHVVHWSLQNTISQVQSGLLEWAAQGLHFGRRVTSMKLLQDPSLLGASQAERIRSLASLVLVPETLNLSDMYEAVQDTVPASFVLQQTRSQHMKHMASALRSVLRSRSPEESALLDDAQHLASVVERRCEKYLGAVQVRSKCFDEEQEKELEEEDEREVDRPGRQEPFQPKESRWIVGLERGEPVSGMGDLAPLWEATQRTKVHCLLSAQDFDPRILASYNFRRTLKYEECDQDEFLRPPRWLLALWHSTDEPEPSVRHLILVSPHEANLLVCYLRASRIADATLHRFSPRTRRDQGELLTSALTIRSGQSQPSADTMRTELSFAVMAMSFFGSTTCLQSVDQFGRCKAEFCSFLNIVPPPSACCMGVDASDWNVLIDEGWINAEGFLVRPVTEDAASKMSDACRSALARTCRARFWKRSPVAAMRALMSVRNMSAFFQRSDVELILLTK